MNVVGNKIDMLKMHIRTLNTCEVCLHSEDYDTMIREAEEIVKLAYFFKSYKELDREREKEVKETVMEYLNENNTYDGTLMECIGYCFGERD